MLPMEDIVQISFVIVLSIKAPRRMFLFIVKSKVKHKEVSSLTTH